MRDPTLSEMVAAAETMKSAGIPPDSEGYYWIQVHPLSPLATHPELVTGNGLGLCVIDESGRVVLEQKPKKT